MPHSIVEEHFGSSVTKDDMILQGMGYKPELKRDYNMLQVFGVSFSIMSLVPSIASVLSQAMGAGGVGMTWGWFIPCIFIMSIGIAMSELGSALPTAGGLYWWTYRFAPRKFKAVLSFFIGYADTLGLIAGVGSINYGFATQLLSTPALSITSYTPNKFETYGVYAGGTLLQLACVCLPNKIMSRIQSFTILVNAVAIFVICIALPVGLHRKGGTINSGEFVFGNTTNYTDWQYGWAWLLAWMPAIWTISSHDAAVHMAEEAANAPIAIPFAIIAAIGLCWILGFVIMAVLAAVVSPNMTDLINTNYGNSLAAIIENCLGGKWAIALMSIFSFIQWCMGLSQLVSSSRQTWAFSRDDGLPFSRWIKITWNSLPVNAAAFNVGVVLIIGLLILVNEIAADAIFSLSVASLQISWTMPITLRTIWFDPNDFVPGPFYLGHTFSRLNGVISTLYSLFVIICLCQIPTVKHPDKSTMNYTVVICVFVWGGSLLYYYLSARKWFFGPKAQVEAEKHNTEMLEGCEPPTFDESNQKAKDAEANGKEGIESI